MKGRSLFFLENFKSLNYFSRMLEIYVSRKTYMRSKLLNQVNILVRIQSSGSWIISLAHETSLYIAWFFFFFFLSWDLQNFAALFISFFNFHDKLLAQYWQENILPYHFETESKLFHHWLDLSPVNNSNSDKSLDWSSRACTCFL